MTSSTESDPAARFSARYPRMPYWAMRLVNSPCERIPVAATARAWCSAARIQALIDTHGTKPVRRAVFRNEAGRGACIRNACAHVSLGACDGGNIRAATRENHGKDDNRNWYTHEDTRSRIDFSGSIIALGAQQPVKTDLFIQLAQDNGPAVLQERRKKPDRRRSPRYSISPLRLGFESNSRLRHSTSWRCSIA